MTLGSASTSSMQAAQAGSENDKENRLPSLLPLGQTEPPRIGDLTPISHATMPRKNEFLQNLDLELMKLQRDDERGPQGSLSGSKYVSRSSSISKASAGRVFDHELGQMLKTPAPTLNGSESEHSKGW